jgi:hypothetical protein
MKCLPLKLAPDAISKKTNQNSESGTPTVRNVFTSSRKRLEEEKTTGGSTARN